MAEKLNVITIYNFLNGEKSSSNVGKKVSLKLSTNCRTFQNQFDKLLYGHRLVHFWNIQFQFFVVAVIAIVIAVVVLRRVIDFLS